MISLPPHPIVIKIYFISIKFSFENDIICPLKHVARARYSVIASIISVVLSQSIANDDTQIVIKYLEKYGYLDDNMEGVSSDNATSVVYHAIALF